MNDEAMPASPPKPKYERSPSFPFISLRKAVERTEALYAGHKRDAARLVAVAPTWGFGAKSSGLLQTVAALKQFGLIEDLGSSDDRKIQITELARRILSDTRPGAREKAIKDAAWMPKLLAEYYPRWIPDRPSDAHCISELHLDRGFTPDSARNFLKVFDDTVDYAGLADDGRPQDEPWLGPPDVADSADKEDVLFTVSPPATRPVAGKIFAVNMFGPKPLSERLEITMNGRSLAGTFTLVSSDEVDTVIKILEANRGVLKAFEELSKGQ